MRNAYQSWQENEKGRDQLEDLSIDGGNIKMDLMDTEWDDVDLIHLV
jgi:hypothetical protein